MKSRTAAFAQRRQRQPTESTSRCSASPTPWERQRRDAYAKSSRASVGAEPLPRRGSGSAATHTPSRRDPQSGHSPSRAVGAATPRRQRQVINSLSRGRAPPTRWQPRDAYAKSSTASVGAEPLPRDGNAATPAPTHREHESGQSPSLAVGAATPRRLRQIINSLSRGIAPPARWQRRDANAKSSRAPVGAEPLPRDGSAAILRPPRSGWRLPASPPPATRPPDNPRGGSGTGGSRRAPRHRCRAAGCRARSPRPSAGCPDWAWR